MRKEERKKICGVTTKARNVGLISCFLLCLSTTGGLSDWLIMTQNFCVHPQFLCPSPLPERVAQNSDLILIVNINILSFKISTKIIILVVVGWICFKRFLYQIKYILFSNNSISKISLWKIMNYHKILINPCNTWMLSIIFNHIYLIIYTDKKLY